MIRLGDGDLDLLDDGEAPRPRSPASRASAAPLLGHPLRGPGKRAVDLHRGPDVQRRGRQAERRHRQRDDLVAEAGLGDGDDERTLAAQQRARLPDGVAGCRRPVVGDQDRPDPRGRADDGLGGVALGWIP